MRTLEAGEEHGLHYLAMEYLAGQTLQGTLDQRGRLGVDEAVNIVHQALLGLQHLHDHGLVHRNLEPANLMLIQPGNSGGDARVPEGQQGPLVKILDIGMVRPPTGPLDGVIAEGKEAGRLTYEGLLLGSPGYLAPEQARDAHGADIRADIYSLGCILYHALAGQMPHQDATPMGQIIRHATKTPRRLREYNPEVPEGLELIVNWMMAKEPSQRYQTPERAAGALMTFLFGERMVLPAAEVQPEILAAPDPLPAWQAKEETATAPIPGQETDAGAGRDATVSPSPSAEARDSPGSFAFPAPARVGSPRQEDWRFSDLSPNDDPAVDRQRFSNQGDNGKSSSHKQNRLGRRDYLLLTLGAGGLLAAQAIGWMLGKVSRKSGRERRGKDATKEK